MCRYVCIYTHACPLVLRCHPPCYLRQGFLLASGSHIRLNEMILEPQHGGPERTPARGTRGARGDTNTCSLFHGPWTQNSGLRVSTASILQMNYLPSCSNFIFIFSQHFFFPSVVLRREPDPRTKCLPLGCTLAPAIVSRPFVLIT